MTRLGASKVREGLALKESGSVLYEKAREDLGLK